MAFRKVLKRTALVGGGAVVTAFGLSQLIEYRTKQVSGKTAALRDFTVFHVSMEFLT